MSDDVLRLRSAFLAERMNVDRPEFLVKCDNYSWRIHRNLLYRQSRDRDKFLKSVSKNGVASKIADLGPEDPWMVARLIQFLYTSTYDVKYAELLDAECRVEFSLENVLHDRKEENPRTFSEDKERDQCRSDLRVHLMMCELASVYDMLALLDHALHRAFQSNQGEKAAEEMLKATATITGTHNILKSDKLRKSFAAYFAENREEISEDMTKQWLNGDGTFAIEVIDYLVQRNKTLEQALAVAEAPFNLKKRRPSVEPVKSSTIGH